MERVDISDGSNRAAMLMLDDCFVYLACVAPILRQEIVGFWALVRAWNAPRQTVVGKKALVTPRLEQKEDFLENK
ncbi:hypothetical protein BK147_04630 [Paenibacillus sp. FSL R7-0337]|uniref:hypothetical protein n=2 Tax=unclassified Paenibacillus TaxID=185978 RepID=UPI00096F1EE0|nr:hypothetical protein [Paenibacillus sp. FSL R7-0337]OMG00487.1 hypothetical protein BK147_04630 [Paenibacillus sp. FSL R7-0337]